MSPQCSSILQPAMESWKSHIISRRIYRPVSEKFQFQAWTSGISFPQKHPDLLWNNPLTPPTQCITRALSWANRKKQEVDRPPASTSKRKNEWMCNSIPLFAFKTCSRTSSSWPYSEIKYVCFVWNVRDLSLPPRSGRELRSSGSLRSQ